MLDRFSDRKRNSKQIGRLLLTDHIGADPAASQPRLWDGSGVGDEGRLARQLEAAPETKHSQCK